MNRIGIYGGSFNPIHTGHISLARQIIDIAKLDEVWLVVSPQNPFKQNSQSLIDDNTRLRLTRKAIEGEPKIKVSDCEFRLPRPSYMWHTLQHLSGMYPDTEFHLIIGADNWVMFDKWYHADDIVSNYHIVVYPRKGYQPDVAAMPHNVSLADTQLYPISSTMIRHMVHEGKDITGLVPERIKADVCSIYAMSAVRQQPLPETEDILHRQ